MGRSPDEIRSSIEDTRKEATETVTAAQERVDVAGRAQDSLAGAAASVSEATDTLSGVAGTAQRALAGDPQARRELTSSAQRAWETLEERPALLAAVASLAGLVLGRLTKRRRR